MNIEHEYNDKQGRFFIPEPDGSTTELVYKTDGSEKMIILHTEVGDKYEGKGIGKTLVSTAVDFAREHHMKVVPVCHFAKAVMERDPQYQDVLGTYE